MSRAQQTEPGISDGSPSQASHRRPRAAGAHWDAALGSGRVLPHGTASWALLPHLHRSMGVGQLEKEAARALEQAGRQNPRQARNSLRERSEDWSLF